MRKTSRDLRASAVSALAKLAVVWVLAVLGAGFMVTAAAAADGPNGPDPDRSPTTETSSGTDAPRTAGLVLVLGLLGAGGLVLTVGSARRPETSTDRYDGLEDTFADDLPLALGLGLGFSGRL